MSRTRQAPPVLRPGYLLALALVSSPGEAAAAALPVPGPDNAAAALLEKHAAAGAWLEAASFEVEATWEQEGANAGAAGA